jgi:hypothetical protein
VGWKYLHVAIDDHSRLSFADLYPNEQAASVAHFLATALRHVARFGIRIKAVLTDSGPAYRSRLFARVCRLHGSNTASPGHTLPAPTVRQSVSSKPPSGSGPARALIRPQQHDPNSFPTGCTDTTGIVPMPGLGLAPPVTRSSLEHNNLLTLHT